MTQQLWVLPNMVAKSVEKYLSNMPHDEVHELLVAYRTQVKSLPEDMAELFISRLTAKETKGNEVLDTETKDK